LSSFDVETQTLDTPTPCLPPPPSTCVSVACLYWGGERLPSCLTCRDFANPSFVTLDPRSNCTCRHASDTGPAGQCSHDAGSCSNVPDVPESQLFRAFMYFKSAWGLVVHAVGSTQSSMLLLLLLTVFTIIYYATHIDAWPIPCQRALARLLRIPASQLQNEQLSNIVKYRMDVVSASAPIGTSRSLTFRPGQFPQLDKLRQGHVHMFSRLITCLVRLRAVPFLPI